ncbi:unnamed protein product [Oikopleura dioica]|uniref:DAZ-associated protein 2 n=1 Tax=Oikopleura dioica TaxID=34765 RepID=E4XBE6_OIKDI|nr:unnamed protein product [Oikopleura dioica]
MGNDNSKNKGIPPPEKSGYPTQGGTSYPTQRDTYPPQENKSPQGYPAAPVPPGQPVQPPHYPNQPAYPPAPDQVYSAHAAPPPYAPPGAPQYQNQPFPGQNPGYPPAQGMYPPHGAPPPHHFQQAGVEFQVAPGQYQPGQQVIVNGGFDAGARFNGNASVPPPPPGCAPNAAQVAMTQGANVQISQKKDGFVTGGGGGGYTMW